MIVTCASCLTKFKLDDSRIPPEGAKVRCSRCQHVFMVTPPAPVSFDSKEEVVENFETFAKHHEELMKPSPKDEEFELPPLAKSAPPKGKGKEMPLEEWEEEPAPFEKRMSSLKEEAVEQAKPRGPARMARKEKRRVPSRFLLLLLILGLVVFGAFYFWSELGPGGKLYPYVEVPIQKATHYWNQLWRAEKEGLTVRDLNGYDEKLRGIPVFIIAGKVSNESRSAKKYIRIRVVIFDQNRNKLAERETLCGRALSREELEKQPIAFYRGDMVIQPESAKERVTPPGNASSFMIIFKDEDLSDQAKEFKVEILEAPNL
jgi:predicted Zn finger-like uncharacterized protein